MATKKTEKPAAKAAKSDKKPTTRSTKPAAKGAPAAKAAKAPKGPKADHSAAAKARHPRARLTAQFQSKAALAKTLASALARPDEDTDQIAERLKTASNSQLLRLQQVTETVKKKYGNREKLIAAIGNAGKKSKDKDYLAKLDTFSLPQLLDLAASAERPA